jgi:hypothetical protein
MNLINKNEFIRLPKSGSRCEITGLSRSAINLLVLPCKENDFKPPVKSHSLKKPGQLKGVRLICVNSLMDYIRGLPA